MNNFWPIVFGHLLADYMFQPKKMAVEKSKNSLVCLVHCLIYTASVVGCLAYQNHNVAWWLPLVVFVSHYPIDRWSLANHWLKLIKGRNVMDAFSKENPDPFAAMVYAVVDNTMHLFLLWLVMSQV